MADGAQVTCCHCGGAFDERKLGGTWLDRRCPQCGERLSEEAYDAQAEDALSRYYTSEWFRLACAGQGSTAPDRGLFGLEPSYAAGAFTLTPADDDRSPEGGLGVSAEYFAFDAVRAEIARPGSPLAGAMLVPHLVFPWLPGQKPKQWGAKHRAEVDFIIMCGSCAIIVEVKRHDRHVRVSSDYQRIRESTEGGSFRSASEPVEQVQRGADSFAERQSAYPPDRIFKMVVFVDPLSFECKGSAFRDGWFAAALEGGDASRMVDALRTLVKGLDPIVKPAEIAKLAADFLAEFGNTRARRVGRIVDVGSPASRGRRTNAFLNALDGKTRRAKSPLSGARLLRGLTCEVETGKRGKGRGKGKRNGKAAETPKFKEIELAGLLLTRAHAVLVDVRRWPVHVNTHAPFATVYTGDPAEGARIVEADIRHDWDLDEIHYKNRSGSLTLLTYAGKSIIDLEPWRERNRVYTLHVFVDPASFVSDCDEFRSRTYLGFWRGAEENVFDALEALEASSEPIMSRPEFDRLVATLSRQDRQDRQKFARASRD